MAKNGSENASATARRAPAGAAVLREDKTAAIRAAVFAELAAVGFARMSIEGIARRAGVGKTAVYRRWRSKLHLVLDVVSALAAEGLPTPDTGTLRGDVRMLLEVAARALRHPMASQIIPDLLAGQQVLVVAHGNSLRALVKHLDGISDEDISELNIPTGIPLVYELDDAFRPAVKGGRYLDPEAAVAAAAAVRNQGR